LVSAYWRHYHLTTGTPVPSPPQGSNKEVVIDAVALQPDADLLAAGDDLWDAWIEVDQCAKGGGPEAILLLVALAIAAPDERALCYLGAGPLEDLVTNHGSRLAEELDEVLDREPRLRAALGCVRVGFVELGPTTRLKDFFGRAGS
jgi:hypothetical protein